MRLSRMNLIAATTLAASALAIYVVAGPLTPPGGPVASTYKTLTEVEPRITINATNTPGDSTGVFKVTQSGSYYLTGNITVPAGKTGIVVAVPQVAIDLNGFTISGGTTGVSSPGFTTQVSLHNGKVSNCSLHGVDLTNSSYVMIEHVSVQGISGTGIGTGASARISDCSVVGGSNAYLFGYASLVDRCLATNASGNGFNGGSECRLSECIAESCTGMGFQVTGFSEHLVHCTSDQSGTRGFDTGPYSLVESCVASSSNGIGFNMGTGSTIRGCIAESNSSQGIVANGGVNVIGNQVRYGPAGIAAIWLQGTQCRAEDNTVTAYGYGVFTTSTSHVIVRNSVTGATTKAFQIGVGNIVGTIVTPSGNAAVISGSSGGSVISTDPNANLVF